MRNIQSNGSQMFSYSGNTDFKNLNVKWMKDGSKACFCYVASEGETQIHLCLHVLTVLSSSLDVTQHVTGEPETTKHI